MRWTAQPHGLAGGAQREQKTGTRREGKIGNRRQGGEEWGIRDQRGERRDASQEEGAQERGGEQKTWSRRGRKDQRGGEERTEVKAEESNRGQRTKTRELRKHDGPVTRQQWMAQKAEPPSDSFLMAHNSPAGATEPLPHREKARSQWIEGDVWLTGCEGDVWLTGLRAMCGLLD